MTSLDALASNYGIQDSSLDARGREMMTTPGVKLAMLAAMGVDAKSEEAALAALRTLEDSEWDHPTPPAVVAYVDVNPVRVPVVRPADTKVLHWLITLENGEKLGGESNFKDLELLEQREFRGAILQRRCLTLRGHFPLGYHKLRIASEPMEMSLIVTPGKCWLPKGATGGQRYWGIAAQLYLLRSQHNWGIGDFTDLKQLIEIAKGSGADLVGVNPLHAMFPDSSEQASPYSPSDRNLLNILNIDVEAIPEFSDSPEAQRLCCSSEFRSAIEDARRSGHVAYSTVAGAKFAALKVVFEAFQRNKNVSRHKSFHAFVAERASLLERACTFQALRSHFAELDPGLADSREWPEEFKNFRSPAVARWAGYNKSLVNFQLWLQWIADQQLRDASDAASGMAIGLYRDLAVGADPSGAEMWCHSDALVSGVNIGAPADIWNPAGQNWGLPPFDPRRLRYEGYKPFIELLQSNMRYCGALRIDHAMALQRLYWIPEGSDGHQGAFIEYPLDDLVGILALESHRNHCLVVGEDLGTVPAGFRERMEEANILSYRVLLFERNEEGFVRSDRYPYLSLSVASSHDLPTLSGWWIGSDLESKAALNLFPTPELDGEARQKRCADRRDLVTALQTEHLLDSAQTDEEAFGHAAQAFLGRTNSLITLIQLDDLTGEVEQVNIPATNEKSNPNWRRKQSVALEDLIECSQFSKIATAMRNARGAGRASRTSTDPA